VGTVPIRLRVGKPEDSSFQHKVLAAALGPLQIDGPPVLAEFPEDGEAPSQLLQATAARVSVSVTPGKLADPVGELTTMRGYYEC